MPTIAKQMVYRWQVGLWRSLYFRLFIHLLFAKETQDNTCQEINLSGIWQLILFACSQDLGGKETHALAFPQSVR